MERFIGVGLMSGTSLDAIDVAVVEFSIARKKAAVEVPFQWKLLKYEEIAYRPEVQQHLRDLMTHGASVRTKDVCSLNVEVAKAFAEAANAVLAKLDTKADFVASHGQTVWHIPSPQVGKHEVRSTLQLGDGCVIAEMVGALTISDFRMRDVACGGVGAPLIPRVDRWMFGSREREVVCQNIGGIGNATLLSHDGSIVAFDTGPGNMIVDALVAYHYGEAMDRNGSYSSLGRVHEGLLSFLLGTECLRRGLPRNFGREDFGDGLVQSILRYCDQHGVSKEDSIRTAVEMTVQTIAESYRLYFPNGAHSVVVYVSGGGAKNPTIMKRLQELLPSSKVVLSDDVVPSDAKEAVGFAMLGMQTLLGQPGNEPSATGASREGKISPDPRRGFDVLIRASRL